MSEHEALKIRLLEVLAAVGIDCPALDEYRELHGGSGDRVSYLVTAGGERWVLRLGAAGADPVLELEAEAALLRELAAAGLTTELVGIDAAEDALVTRHIEAVPWTRSDALRERNIERVALLLRRLHGQALPCRDFAPSRFAARYLERARSHRRFDTEHVAWADELLARAADYEQAHRPTVLCHNDLVAANILDNGTLTLVDFEYAVRAKPIVDLASLAAMNDYGKEQRKRLLAAYYGPDQVPRPDDAELLAVVRLQRLLAYFWALAARPGTALASLRAAFAQRSILDDT